MTSGERNRPARLQPGDQVAVVAPAGPVSADQLDAGVAVLRSWGLDVKIGDHVLDRHPELPYLAGSDADRAADLQRAWCDPNVAAVLCARGGYGCLRLLELLDLSAMTAAAPTLFAGSSDVTALHEVLGGLTDLVTLFSPMVATTAFVEDAATQEHLRLTLFEPERVQVLTRPGAGALVPGRATGITSGGNASLVAASLGAKVTAGPPAGSILLLEDVTEDAYQLDRILTQLSRAGWFDAVAGIALGSWTACGPLDDVRAVMRDRLGSLGIPIVWELGFGHCEAQLTMPLGVRVELDATAGRVTVATPALH